MSDSRADRVATGGIKRNEIVAFIILAVVIWPVMAVGIVGSYGLLIWMWQIVFGPPGPPH